MDDEALPPLGRHEAELERRPERNPIFNLPTALTATLGLLFLIFAVQNLFSDDTLDWFFVTFGFIPIRYATPLSAQGPEWLWTPVTYSLLHANIEHILFNSLWLMAFGSPVVRRIGTVRYVILWILSAAAAAALNAAIHWGGVSPLIGASGVVSALMGAACRFAFPPVGRGRGGPLAHLNPRLTIVEALRSKTVVIFILIWLLGNLLIALGLPLVGDGSEQIAWDAHIGGFLFGFLLFSLFDRRPVADARAETIAS